MRVSDRRDILHGATALFGCLLDYWAPQYCVLCGRRISGDMRAQKGPLCKMCLRQLPPEPKSRCVLCGKELYAEEATCYPCRGAERSYDEAYSLYRYWAAPAVVIRSYKMSKRRSFADFWADRLEPVIRERWPEYVLVPVPPRPEKRRTFAWDQVEAIAARLEKRGISVMRLLLRSASDEQKRLGREGRKKNAEKGYKFDPACPRSAPAQVLLFDDIYTTGATAEACAAALRANGAQKVSVLVLAMD